MMSMHGGSTASSHILSGLYYSFSYSLVRSMSPAYSIEFSSMVNPVWVWLVGSIMDLTWSWMPGHSLMSSFHSWSPVFVRFRGVFYIILWTIADV